MYNVYKHCNIHITQQNTQHVLTKMEPSNITLHCVCMSAPPV